jgi:undecaprenyl pyrophosphate phosphatase UppP
MWVRRHGFVIFAIYRIVLAALLFWLGKKLMMAA